MKDRFFKLFTRFQGAFLYAANGLKKIGLSVFGQLSWNPPRWFSQSTSASARFTRVHPHLTLAGILVTFALASAAGWTWRWYQSQPKPRWVTVTARPIPVTKLNKDGSRDLPDLIVAFGQSVAQLEDLKKTELQGVQLEPRMPGGWHWAADNLLIFRPTEDWPADQKFRIIFEKKFFPRHILMERLVYETCTPPFTIAVKGVEFYQDPINPSQRQVTATLALTHSVEPGELDRHIQLAVIGGSTIFSPSDPSPHFSLTYGPYRRVAYLRSSQVILPDREDFLRLVLSKGVRTIQGGAQTHDEVEAKVRIPSLVTMFRIDSTAGTIARNKNGEPEQLLVLNTSAEISTRDLAKALEIRLLPKRKPETQKLKSDDASEGSEVTDEESSSEETDSEEADSSEESEDAPPAEKEKWESPAEVPPDVLDQAKRVKFATLPTDKEHDRQHVFRVQIESDGELYLRVRKGVRALGDYPLSEDYNAVIPVPELPREVQFEGQGGLLALSGERKLSVRSRGLATIEYEIARVGTTQINHLVSQTEGNFQNPDFLAPYIFNQENISRIALEHQSIVLENKWKANYSAFDFSEHLRKPADGGSERGLFFLTARGWDPVKKKPLRSINDRRFILVTDTGIVTKKNADGSHDVFLMSIKTGKPIASATVDILGKNGIAIQSATTDASGHCAFPSVEKSAREKSPVAFVARNGDDVAFIPYAREDRVLNFSRFDTDGAENVLPENLDAFVFTERGVYRPGDEIHIGLVIKQRSWSGNLKGLPVETVVTDARGLSVQTKKVTLPETGFTELSYQTANESPTGLYRFDVYLIKNNKRSTLLGSASAQVKEFLPDRMKIETRLSETAPRGWINPKDVSVSIVLANLYGTPATDRRITGRMELAPDAFSFPEFPDFVFYDPLRDEKKDPRWQSVDLGEKKTDEHGRTQFDLQLERFADATYAMRFIAEGFEAEGGRSVTGCTGERVSALPYIIGGKADGDLHYIAMDKPRAVDLVAVDPNLDRIAVENITLNVIAQEYISVLTQQENGNYAYESVLKERVTKTERISIAATGSHYPLPTAEPGNYVFELRDDQNRRVIRLDFCVVGHGAVSRSLEKNAELEVKLDRAKYNTGDDIAVSITAPYAGSGLITIERDKVYAHAWFQATTAASVQHVRVPEGFEGSGYINVAFVRALDSKEIFVSPLSYGVVPFTANIEKRRLKIDLQTAPKSKPGEPLRISYKTDRAARIVIFAVDQGILQVTDYQTPDPLGFFFRKCALAVQTTQIVDLIIPELSILRSVSAFGGGGDIQRLNPFKRVTDKPVVFWSGIIDADITPREVIYDVPDYFDGTLKIMAVAVSNETTGDAEREMLIRGPFVITPSVPVLVAPGDEFEAGVTVANNIEGSGSDAEIELRAETNGQLSTKGSPTQKLRIAEGREQSAIFHFRVNDKLGSGEIKFIATRGTDVLSASRTDSSRGESVGQAGAAPASQATKRAALPAAETTVPQTTRRATLSVRPPVPYMTDVRSGSFKNNGTEIPITRAIHPEFRKLNATISAAPLGLAHGLDIYLKDFPHGCSEQITSGAFCRLLLVDEADFGLSRAEINKQLEYTFGVLRRRQNDQGGFGYWAPETGDRISFVSAYVMDFLSEAKAVGFAPPAEMFTTGLRNLQKMVAREPGDLSEARTVAYAIYVLTREGVITTNYILNLRDYLDKHQRDNWQNDITAVYLAGALHLLHKDEDAEKLIAKYKIDKQPTRFCDDFYQSLGTDSQYVAVLAREFPARLRKISAQEFENILRPIGQGWFNTLSAAYAVRALKAYSHAIAQNSPELSISEIKADKNEVRLTSGSKSIQRHDFSGEASALRFRSTPPLSGAGAYFQVVEAGFDRHVPAQPVSDGLEVYRELLDAKNKPASRTQLGQAMHVRLHVRSLQDRPVTNVAIVDLLPGGFEILDSSLRHGVSPIHGVDYVDIREDRAVFFVTAPVSALEIDYQIKSCNRGNFVVPPVFAQSMYDRNVKGRGVGGRITVTQ
jgi:uncharacterized protein YfaS (alpha-2-macroglobulin family)